MNESTPRTSTRYNVRKHVIQDGLVDKRIQEENVIPLGLLNILNASMPALVDLTILYYLTKENSYNNLAGVGLGLTWYNVAAWTMANSMCSLIGNQMANHYNQKRYLECGHCYFNGALSMTVLGIVLMLPLLYCESVLQFIYREHEYTKIAGDFARWLTPHLFLQIHFELLKKLLQAQQKTVPATIVTVLTTLIHIYLCFGLQNRSWLRSYGLHVVLAVAKTLTMGLNLLLLVLYVVIYHCVHGCRSNCSFSSMCAGLCQCDGFRIFSALYKSLCLWPSEALNLLAASVSAKVLAFNTVLHHFNRLFLSYGNGVGFVLGTSIRTIIHANKISEIHRWIRRAVINNILIMVIVCGVCVFLADSISKIFFKENPQDFVIFFYILLVVEVFNTTQAILQYTFMAIGRAELGRLWLIVLCYGLMLPIAFVFLEISNEELWCLWIAVGVTAILMVAGKVLILYWAKWEQFVDEAQHPNESASLLFA